MRYGLVRYSEWLKRKAWMSLCGLDEETRNRIKKAAEFHHKKNVEKFLKSCYLALNSYRLKI